MRGKVDKSNLAVDDAAIATVAASVVPYTDEALRFEYCPDLIEGEF
jgi:hypothetical protein